MIIVIIIILLLLSVKCVTDIIATKINKDQLIMIRNLRQRNELLVKTIKLIRNQLNLVLLKDCPESERIEIPRETIQMIDDIEKYF